MSVRKRVLIIGNSLYQRLLSAYLLAFLLALAVFLAFPGLDMAGARYFFAGAAPGPVLTSINDILRGMMEAVGWIALFGGMLLWLRRVISRPALKCWAFLALNLLIGPGLIVNVMLKDHLGRARPVQLSEFGGSAHFTRAWQLSDQCSRNCSFTSGDVALAATLSICALVLAWPFLAGRGRRLAVAAAILLTLATGWLRMSLGRHFPSDVVFSILISAGTALALYRFLSLARVDLRAIPLTLPGPLAAMVARLAGRSRHPDA